MYDIHFTFQFADFEALVEAQLKRNKRRSRVVTALSLVILIPVALLFVWSTFQGEVSPSTLTLIGAIAVFIVLFRLFGVRPLRRWQYRKSGLENLPMHLTVDESCWIFRQRGMTTSGTWENCETLDVAQSHWFIWLSRREALVIPRDAVPEQQAKSLTSFLETRIPN